MANRIETSLLVKGLTADTYALDVRGKTFVDGDIEINGNVNIVGTATTINTQTVQARDNKIELNYSGSTSTAIGGGIEILSGRTDGSSVSLTIDTDRDWNSNTGLNISGRTSDATTNGLKVVNSLGTDNFVVRNDGNVGIGTSTPDSKLVIKGSDSSSSNYGLKVQNSGGTNSLVVRNDNQVMVNADNTPDDIRFYTKANGSTDYPLYVANSGSLNILAVRGNGKITANGGSDYDVGFQIGNQFNETMPFRVKNYNNQALFAVYENGFTSTNGRANFGSNAISLPDSIVQIIGSDSSTGFGLKVKNSGGTDNLIVRNDGNVGIGTSTPNAKLEVNGNTNLQSFTATSATINGNLTFTGQSNNPIYNLGNVSSTYVPNWNNGNIQSVILTSTTTSFSGGTNIKDGAVYTIILKQDNSGNRSVNWSSTYKWQSGIPPVISSYSGATDILTFVSDGTYLYGLIAKDFR